MIKPFYHKKIMLTGCLGFIGSTLAHTLINLGHYVVGVDSETYAANLEYLTILKNTNKFTYIKSDINDLDRIPDDVDIVINTAAESHVDSSINSSEIFVKTNVQGVQHLLDLIKNKQRKPLFLQFSTDEVYGDIVTGSHTESSPLEPSNPYAASKAAADLLIKSYSRTHNIEYVIVRPTNNYGVGQHTEKFIPKTIRSLYKMQKVELHDNGEPKRTWLHVRDTCSAIVTIINSGFKNEIFNISGNIEYKNIEVFTKIFNMFELPGKAQDWIEHFKRKGQDVRYSVDDNKLKSLGWFNTVTDFDYELKQIVNYSVKRS